MGCRTPEENRAFSKMQHMTMTALRHLADDAGIEWKGATRKELMKRLVEDAPTVSRLGGDLDGAIPSYI